MRRLVLAAAVAVTQAGCVQAVHDCFDGKGCRAMLVQDEFVCRLPAPRAADEGGAERIKAARSMDRPSGCQGGCVDLR